MGKSYSNSQLAIAKSSRPYKSRSQRPCDFCRRRKTCCIIEGTIPCTPCIQFNQSKCTFNEGPMKRNNKQENKEKAGTSSPVSTKPLVAPLTLTTSTAKPKIVKTHHKLGHTTKQQPHYSKSTSLAHQKMFKSSLMDAQNMSSKSCYNQNINNTNTNNNNNAVDKNNNDSDKNTPINSSQRTPFVTQSHLQAQTQLLSQSHPALVIKIKTAYFGHKAINALQAPHASGGDAGIYSVPHAAAMPRTKYVVPILSSQSLGNNFTKSNSSTSTNSNCNTPRFGHLANESAIVQPKPSLASLSIKALDLVQNYSEYDNITYELSELLESDDSRKKRKLSQLSKLSQAIFNVFNSTSSTDIVLSTMPANDVELTDSSVYSNNQFSPNRAESLTSVDTSSLYNLDSSLLLVQPLDVDFDMGVGRVNLRSNHQNPNLNPVTSMNINMNMGLTLNTMNTMNTMNINNMNMNMSIQKTFIDEEFQKVIPDPLFAEHFQDQFPLFLLSPESDVF